MTTVKFYCLSTKNRGSENNSFYKGLDLLEYIDDASLSPNLTQQMNCCLLLDTIHSTLVEKDTTLGVFFSADVPHETLAD